MTTKAIRTEDQYHSYLREVENLMSRHKPLSAADADKLELLTIIIEAYENSKYPIEPPDPIDAIQFRMEQKGLKQADLISYFGTSSRVSEVLKRKRPLTVQMIRAISLGLGISAETLVGLAQTEPKDRSINWSKFPVREMMKRGWLDRVRGIGAAATEDLVKQFISDAGLQFGTASFKRTLSGDADSPLTHYALYAWLARVIQRARERRSKVGEFEEGILSADFLRNLAKLSWSHQGPLVAIELLERHGISVVIEPHLKGTQVDGAALRDVDGTPIVALTLRYDRLDNFWFTLLHEVAHLWKHVSRAGETFIDDLNIDSEDRREAEANRLAREAFIPRLIWKRSEAYLSPTKESVDKLSKELKIHPAIIVGRLRRETGNYALFPDLLGQGEVKSLFSLAEAGG